MDTEGAWKAVALAALTVSTGLIGTIVALVRRAKPNGMTNGNKLLLQRLNEIDRRLINMEDSSREQDRKISYLEGRLEHD